MYHKRHITVRKIVREAHDALVHADKHCSGSLIAFSENKAVRNTLARMAMPTSCMDMLGTFTLVSGDRHKDHVLQLYEESHANMLCWVRSKHVKLQNLNFKFVKIQCWGH